MGQVANWSEQLSWRISKRRAQISLKKYNTRYFTELLKDLDLQMELHEKSQEHQSTEYLYSIAGQGMTKVIWLHHLEIMSVCTKFPCNQSSSFCDTSVWARAMNKKTNIFISQTFTDNKVLLRITKHMRNCSGEREENLCRFIFRFISIWAKIQFRSSPLWPHSHADSPSQCNITQGQWVSQPIWA